MPAQHNRTTLLDEPFTQVLDAARAGGAWAFQRLYESYAGAIAGFARARGAEDPEGVANDVFLSAFGALDRFSGDERAFRAWLFAIARNRIIDEQRKRSRRPSAAEVTPEELDPAGGDVEVEALDRLGDERVRALLHQLSDDQRDVLLLRIVGDLRIDQIAEVVGKRPGAVKALQRRGLATLRKILDEGVPL